MPNYNEYGQYMMPTGQLSPRDPRYENSNFGGGPIDVAIGESLRRVGGGVRGFFNILKNGTKYDRRRRMLSPGDMDTEGIESAVYEDMPNEEPSMATGGGIADTGGEQRLGGINPDDMSFGEAFNHYRKLFKNNGNSIFKWRGNEYTTETREERDRRLNSAKQPSAASTQPSAVAQTSSTANANNEIPELLLRPESTTGEIPELLRRPEGATSQNIRPAGVPIQEQGAIGQQRGNINNSRQDPRFTQEPRMIPAGETFDEPSYGMTYAREDMPQMIAPGDTFDEPYMHWMNNIPLMGSYYTSGGGRYDIDSVDLADRGRYNRGITQGRRKLQYSDGDSYFE